MVLLYLCHDFFFLKGGSLNRGAKSFCYILCMNFFFGKGEV